MRLWWLSLLVACSRSPNGDSQTPWVPPPEPPWGDLPKTDADAHTLVARETVIPAVRAKRFDAFALRAIHADASKLIAGEDAIAATYDGFMTADSKKPAYLLFGTLHDAPAQIEGVLAIVIRMRTLWGFALEQFRTGGRWRGAPDVPSNDDADLATLTRTNRLDEPALYRIRERQVQFDHAAWKFGYVPVLTNLLYAARGAGLAVLGCDMPPEFRVSLTSGGSEERSLRELHCARALRSASASFAPAHATGDAGLSEDDEIPPERYALLLGADHAEPEGLPRFLRKTVRWAAVRVLGGRPADSEGDESTLADKLVVLEPIVVRALNREGPDALLLPDDVWGGHVERTTEHGASPAASGSNLPRPNVMVTSDEPARFAVGESSVDVGSRLEWLSARAGHEAFILVTPSRTILGAVDVPVGGFAELHFTPKTRAVRIVVHMP